MHIPNEFWEDRVFALSVVDIIAKWIRNIEGLGALDEVIPKTVFDSPGRLRYSILALCQANELNAAEFWIYPTAAWKSEESIFLILSGLADAIGGDSYNMYPTFRANTQDYLESFLHNVPAEYKTDKDFVLEFLEYDTLQDGFEALYTWMDSSLWADREVVTKILENDFDLVDRVADELKEDEDFK